MALSKSNPLLQTLLYYIPLFLILANKVHSQNTFFIFSTFRPNPRDLTYEGDARVQPGKATLSLAGIDCCGKSRSASVGRVLYSKPVQFWKKFGARQANFETSIQFLINPSTYGSAEGIAFFIAPYDTPIPDESVGGNLGIFDGPNTTSIFAVEFDTNYNAWDPTYNHIGIDIESRTSSNVTRFDAGTGQEVIARINYDSKTKIITVVASSGNQVATLKYVFDLKTILPERVQVGITSSTGWYNSIIGLPEIRSWYFTSSLVYATNGTVNDGNKNEDDAYITQTVSV